MKKLIFIVIMLFAAVYLFSDTMDDAKSILEKGDEYYQDFQQKYKTLTEYDASLQAKDTLKQVVEMINRYKKLVDEKFIEIDGLEKTGRGVPRAEFDQLKILIGRYHEMTADLAQWLNSKN